MFSASISRFGVKKIRVVSKEHIYVFCIYFMTNAIISLYSINWSVFFITETEIVYCAVQTGSLNIIQFDDSLYNVQRK